MTADPSTQPRIENVADRPVFAALGTATFIDIGRDATVTASSLHKLTISLAGIVRSEERLGIATAGTGVELSNGTETRSRISVGGLEVGTVTIGWQSTIEITFNDAATVEHAQQIIRALTYLNTASDPGYLLTRSISMWIEDDDGSLGGPGITVTAARPGAFVATTGSDRLEGTSGDDVFLVTPGTLNAGDVLSGGDGDDTLYLKAEGGSSTFVLTNLNVSGIETITGGQEADVIHLTGGQLSSLKAIDGGGGPDRLIVEGGHIDLTGTTVTGLAAIELKTHGANVTVSSKATAGTLRARETANDSLTITDEILTKDERQALHDQGLDRITDAAGVTTVNTAPTIANLGGRVEGAPGEVILLDAGRDAIVATDDEPIHAMLVTVVSLAAGELGVWSPSGDVELVTDREENVTIFVDGVLVGRVFTSSGAFDVYFDDKATANQVGKIIQALSYRHDLSGARATIEIAVQDVGGRRSTYQVAVNSTGQERQTFTIGTDNLLGTADNDIFAGLHTALNASDAVDGGAGIDTIELLEDGSANRGAFQLDHVAITDIEVVRGSDLSDTVILTAGQVAALDTVDGGANDSIGDRLLIRGTAIDLTNTTIVGFETIALSSNGAQLIVDEIALAMIVDGYGIKDDHLILTNGTLDAAHRKIIHDRGIDTISDGAGIVTINTAPRLGGLDGDVARTVVGRTVAIDVNADALLADDDAALDALIVNAWNAAVEVRIGIRTEAGRVELRPDDELSDRILIDGVDIGWVFQGDGTLSAAFNDNATPARVQTLLRALTYTNRDPNNRTVGHNIEIFVSDKGGRSAEANVGVFAEANRAPTSAALNTAFVAEMAVDGTEVGTLQARDPNEGETFAFSLLDDAGGRFVLRGGKLLVADGSRIDYETARSHDVVVRVTDGGGLTVDQRLTIAVQDVVERTGDPGGEPRPGVIAGGPGRDILVGTAAGDTIEGGAGNDRLYGRQGQDLLKGGSGRDVFVFDSPIARKSNANVDVIADFVVRDDSIWLDNAIFKALGKGTPQKPVMLKKDAFWIGAKAHDRDDRVIYDAKKGHLLYDADGSGKGAAILIATLQPKLKMTHADFFVI